MDAVALLLDVTALAERLITKPLIVEIEPQRRACDELQQRLEGSIAAWPAAHRYLDSFAPLCLQAIARALYRRAMHDEDGAADFDAVVGSLLPKVRQDAARAMAAMREPDARPVR
jgi:hypothetical protein